MSQNYGIFVTTPKVDLKNSIEQRIFSLIDFGLDYIQTIADFAVQIQTNFTLRGDKTSLYSIKISAVQTNYYC